MKEFVIVSDSCCDLDTEIRKEYNIDYLRMYISYDGKDLPASLEWDIYSAKEFYDLLRNGTRITTAQITADSYYEAFENYIKEGKDILSLTCSSALSASIHASRLARERLLKVYPESKIYCIDTLNSCLGEGLIALTAAKMRNEGKNIDEIAEWIESNKLCINQVGTVEDLIYIKRAGRISATSAVFGGLLQIKPIIISDAIGQNFPLEKVRGRRASINRMLELTKQNIVNPAEQTIFISHGDCIAEAEQIRDRLINEIGCKNVYINYTGPIIGSATGPGMLGIYFVGTEVKVNAAS